MGSYLSSFFNPNVKASLSVKLDHFSLFRYGEKAGVIGNGRNNLIKAVKLKRELRLLHKLRTTNLGTLISSFTQIGMSLYLLRDSATNREAVISINAFASL
jgi:hypothetical protein